MKINDILSLAGSLTGLINPAIGAGITLINKFLSDKDDVQQKQLPDNSTVNDIKTFLDNLPNKYSEQIKQMEVDLRLDDNYTQRYIAMCNADNQETRAKICLVFTYTTCFIILIFTGFVCMAVFQNPKIVAESNLYILFGILTGIPSSILYSYFGNLRKEQGQRLGIKPTSLFK